MSAAATPVYETESLSNTASIEERARNLKSIRRTVEHNPTESTPAILGQLLLDPREYAPVVDAVRRGGGGVTTNSSPCDSRSNLQTDDVTDALRAALLHEYLEAIQEVCPNPLLMPLGENGKQPAIVGRCSLDSNEARNLLHTPRDAIEAVANGHKGFALYAGREEHGTANVVLVDHDDLERFALDTLPSTLTVLSGSGRGFHETFLNDGTVQNAVGKDDYADSGEIRAQNLYCVLPGAIHPSDGVYHVAHKRSVSTLSASDIPKGLRPSEGFRPSAEGVEDGYADVDDETEHINAEGLSLAEVRKLDGTLDALLSERYPEHIDTKDDSAIDAKLVSKLRYHHFNLWQIASVWKQYRSRPKLSRDDYVQRTIKNCASHDDRATYSDTTGYQDNSGTEPFFSDFVPEYGSELWERPLTLRGVKIREATIRESDFPMSLSHAQGEFALYIIDNKNVEQVYEHGSLPSSHRFTERYSRTKYGELAGVDRKLQEEFEDLYCAFITLRGNQYNTEDGFRCPVDHLSDLLESNKDVTSALGYYLDGRRYARLSVLGAHKQGYTHVHHGLWIEGKIDRETLDPVVDAHLRHCPIAFAKEHQYDKAIRIWKADPDSDYDRSEDVPLTGLARDLGSHLPAIGGSVLDSEPSTQRFSTVLWASGRTQWRPSSSFREWVGKTQRAYQRAQSESDSPSSPSVTGNENGMGGFIGVRFEEDGEIHELKGGASEYMAEARTLPDELDPVDFSY